jgi:hypothetical protein
MIIQEALNKLSQIQNKNKLISVSFTVKDLTEILAKLDKNADLRSVFNYQSTSFEEQIEKLFCDELSKDK